MGYGLKAVIRDALYTVEAERDLVNECRVGSLEVNVLGQDLGLEVEDASHYLICGQGLPQSQQGLVDRPQIKRHTQ